LEKLAMMEKTGFYLLVNIVNYVMMEKTGFYLLVNIVNYVDMLTRRLFPKAGKKVAWVQETR
jgi:hypothetical protein